MFDEASIAKLWAISRFVSLVCRGSAERKKKPHGKYEHQNNIKTRTRTSNVVEYSKYNNKHVLKVIYTTISKLKTEPLHVDVF